MKIRPILILLMCCGITACSNLTPCFISNNSIHTRFLYVKLLPNKVPQDAFYYTTTVDSIFNFDKKMHLNIQIPQQENDSFWRIEIPAHATLGVDGANFGLWNYTEVRLDSINGKNILASGSSQVRQELFSVIKKFQKRNLLITLK